MRILFFNYEYPPLGGGAANATFFIMKEYAKLEGLEVDVVTSSPDSEFHEEKVGGGVKVYKLPIGKNSGNLHFQSQKDLLVYAWKAYRLAKKMAAEKPYDLTHSFFSVPCGYLSYRLKKKFATPYIISLRGSDVPGYSDRFPLIYFFLKPLIKKIWKNAHSVVSNSSGLKELAKKSSPEQEIGIIYNGIDTENFKPGPLASAGEKRPFIITPGASRITDRKGLNYLIEAVGMLVIKFPDIKLKIMGDGNARAALEEQVERLKLEDKVEFLGRIPREKTAPYYQEADVFVLPSLNEGMSNAMLEALSSGLPLLCTDTGGAEELLEENVNGFLIRMKDAADIAEKIERFIRDQELVKKMGAASREKAMKMSWKNVAESYRNLYRSISQK